MNTVNRKNGRCGFPAAALCAALILSVAQSAFGAEEKEYAVALAMYERELFKVSYQYFQDFITNYPEGRFADSAQFYLGESLRALGSNPEAIHEYRQLTANYPESPYVGKALLRIGDCFRTLENYEQAKKYYRKTISRASDRSDAEGAYVNLGGTYFAEGDFGNAIEVYEKTLEEFPDHPQKRLIQYRLGLTYFLHGDTDMGLKYLTEVTGDPSTGDAATYGAGLMLLYTGSFREAADELNRFYVKGDETLRYGDAVRYYTALALTGAGDYEEAADLARESTTETPEGASTALFYYVLGYDLYSTGSWEPARIALNEAVKNDPASGLAPIASFLISLTYLEEKRFDEAGEGFSALASSDPRWSPKARYWLGWIEYEEGNYGGAAGFFGEAADDPNAGDTAPAAAYWQGYCEKRRGNTGTAEEVFVSLAKEYPDNELADDALLKAAEIAMETGRDETGRSRLNELISNYADSEFVEKATYLIAHSYAAQKDPGPAVAKLSEFLKKHPESEYAPNAAYDIGMVLFGDGDYASASGWFERILVLYPGSALADDATYQQGQCRFNRGEYDRASQIYESLIEMYPKSSRIDEARYQLELCKYKQGEYRSQVEVAEAYVTKYPKSRLNKDLYLLLGQSYYRKGAYDRSLDYLGRIDDSDAPTFVTARNLMYEIRLRKSEPEEAAAVLRGVVDSRASKKDRADALLKLAELYESAGDADKAISAYGEFARNFPEDERAPETLLAAGSTMRDLKMYAESNVILENLIAKYPSAREIEIAELYVAFNYQRLGDYDNAMKYHKRVIELGRRSLAVQSYYWLGVCELDLGNKETAKGYFKKIITNYRDFPKWVNKAETELSKL
jgi:TolA-binding protein